MNKTIFGSESERKLYHKIESRWNPYLNIYPQLLPKSVFGYNEILNSKLDKKEKEFLLYSSTEFDFVVCDKNDKTILIIEFDGIKGGYSNNGKYFSFTADKFRRRKLNTKLKAADMFRVELLVISFDEIEELDDMDNPLIILDGILGRYLSNIKFHEIISNQLETYEIKNKKELEMLILESEVKTDLKYNILIQETKKIQERIGHYGLHQEILPRIDSQGLVGSIFKFTKKIEYRDGKNHNEYLTAVKIYVRDVNGLGSILVEDIGKYCLYRKVEKLMKT